VKEKERQHRINHEIKVPEVRLVGIDGEQVGIVKTSEAIKMAQENDVDLVEISGQSSPPVCRLMDYGKFRYQETKKQQEAKKNRKVIQVKEVKLRPETDENDYNIKVRALKKFLEEGDKAKITLRFRGREITHSERGMKMVERIAQDLDEFGQVEQAPKFEGRQIVMILSPKKKK
jgi:translation initiation factor IF-3